MSLSPRRAARLLRQFNAGMNDPMTQAMCAGEFVSQAFDDKLRRLGLNVYDVSAAADAYHLVQYEKRTKYKDPARMKWKVSCSMDRANRYPF